MVGRLFVVATPIGNLRDITLRALDVLRDVPLVAAEDTRHTRKLLQHYGLSTPLTSYHEHNKQAKLPVLLEALHSHDVALVTDAGTPGISDPGRELVAAAAADGVSVIAVPGPSALAAAVSVAGLPATEVHFLGFLPRRSAKRRRRLAAAAGLRGVLVLFEAPHRIVETLQDLHATLGDRPVVMVRELTKVHEEVVRTTVGEALAHVEAQPPRGEFTLVVGGAPARAEAAGAARAAEGAEGAPAAPSPEWLSALVEETGDRREALARAARLTGLPKKQLYRLLLEAQQPEGGDQGPGG